MAKLERAQVDTANLAFWHKPGRLSDLLVPVGGGSGPAREAQPTGNYALFKWYGEMSGKMVETTPPAREGRTIEVGEPTPAPATRIPGRAGSGNAIKLNGSDPNQYVELPPGVVGALTDFTISAWVNMGTVTDWARLFDFGTGTGTYMFLAPRSGSGTVRFAITTSGGGGEQQINGTAPLSPGWTHVAVTKSGTTGTLYVNGAAVGSNPNMTLGPSDLAGGNTTNNWLGRSQYSDPLLDAAIDDFQIHDRALTAAELEALMGAPASGNVVAYRFDEAGGETVADASGTNRNGRVITRIEGVEHLPAPDGFASADRRKKTVRVVFGGGDGDLQLKVRGLRRFGREAHVRVSTTEWTGTDGVSDGPVTLFAGSYPVRHGRISVPVNDIKDTDGYLAVITPDRHGHGGPRPARRHEAEDVAGGRESHSLASDNAYAVLHKRRDATFTVDAPKAGAYDLVIRYSSPEAVTGTVEVNGRARRPVEYARTGRAAPFASQRTHVVLKRGRNRIGLAVRAGSLGLDYVEVTPFRTRVEAESGAITGAALVRVDMSEGNFFANAFSEDAYVRGLSQPTSNLRLPVTVPAAGTYRLTIGYSTAGSEQERRAQIKSMHILRVDDGPWQVVSYDPTQFREMLRQTTALVPLPAGTSTLTLAKGDPSHPGGTQPGTVDLDYVDVELAPVARRSPRR